MSADSKSFAARLHQVFDLDEVEAQDRVPRLARAAEVTKRTARRWLAGECLPADPYRVFRISEARGGHGLAVSGESPRPRGLASPEGSGGPAAGEGHGRQERRLSGGPRGPRGDSGHRALRRAGQIGRDDLLAAL
jgi:hypothetical protein